MQIIKQETLQDAAGSYVAYTYADGHVETDPVGHPLSKEDVQRQRRQEIAQQQTVQALAADRARFGITEEPGDVQRSKAVTASAKAATRDYSTFLHSVSQIAPTATVPAMKGGPIENLINTVAIGGEIEGYPRYATDLSRTDETVPAELRPGVR